MKDLLLEIPDVGEDRDFERPRDRGSLDRAVSYLIDTNVISELRKGERAGPAVVSWFAGLGDNVPVPLPVVTACSLPRRGSMASPSPPAIRRTSCVPALPMSTRSPSPPATVVELKAHFAAHHVFVIVNQ